jgi:hypothetical protein
MRIAYHNEIDALATSSLTALTSDANYPISNVQDQRLKTVWHSTSDSAQTVIINMGSAVPITTAAVMGHNLTASALTTIAGGTSASVFTTAQTITYNSDMMLKFFTAAKTFQYWKFSINNPTNPDTYLSIGRLWLGTYITVDPSALTDFTVSKLRSDNVRYGRSRQKFASIGVGWRKFELSFPKTGGTMLTAIQTMYDTVGKHSSLIFCNFDTDVSYPIVYPCYCSIQEDLEFNHQGRMKFDYSLVLEEDK